MEGAVFPLVIQIATGRDHLGLDGIIAFPGDLAEVGGLTAPDQGLQLGLRAGAHHLHLQVPAAGRASPVIGRGAGGDRTGVLLGLDHWEAPGGKGEVEEGQALARYHLKSVTPQSAGLFRPPGPTGHFPGMPQGGTPGRLRGISRLEMPAPDVEHRVDQQVSRRPLEPSERDMLYVAEQPGRLVIERLGRLLERANPERDRQLLALGTEALALRKREHPANLSAERALPD
jgi:hypothetical protein